MCTCAVSWKNVISTLHLLFPDTNRRRRVRFFWILALREIDSDHEFQKTGLAEIKPVSFESYSMYGCANLRNGRFSSRVYAATRSCMVGILLDREEAFGANVETDSCLLPRWIQPEASNLSYWIWDCSIELMMLLGVRYSAYTNSHLLSACELARVLTRNNYKCLVLIIKTYKC